MENKKMLEYLKRASDSTISLAEDLQLIIQEAKNLLLKDMVVKMFQDTLSMKNNMMRYKTYLEEDLEKSNQAVPFVEDGEKMENSSSSSLSPER